MTPIDVLISLHRGYGLGDAVQMSAVLRHVAKYRPHWRADFQAEIGKHVIGRGIVNGACFPFGKSPEPDKRYDAEVEILLFDTWAGWTDRPNTRVSSALHERFGMAWDAECGRYQINLTPDAEDAAEMLLRRGSKVAAGGRSTGRQSDRLVAIHYQGDTAQEKKNLTHPQGYGICVEVERLKCSPVILDWRGRSNLPYRRLSVPQEWGRDAEMQCAVIAECEAFVGIDSGPAKCASATSTPALVVWTGHHPAPFHDPSSNTTHLVPEDYHALSPVRCDPEVIEWFEAHYQVRTYRRDPLPEIRAWLREVLG